jgi:hypothetical protein
MVNDYSFLVEKAALSRGADRYPYLRLDTGALDSASLSLGAEHVPHLLLDTECGRDRGILSPKGAT